MEAFYFNPRHASAVPAPLRAAARRKTQLRVQRGKRPKCSEIGIPGRRDAHQRQVKRITARRDVRCLCSNVKVSVATAWRSNVK